MQSRRAEDQRERARQQEQAEVEQEEQPIRIRVHPPPTEAELLRRSASRYDEILATPLTFDDLHGIPRRR